MKRPTAASSASRISRLDLQQMRLITRTARLHYIHGKRQAEIAEEMGISQASVSRFLSLAEEHGIVRTIVVPPEGLYPDLEDSLVSRFGLESAYVVDINARESGLELALGAAAAQCLGEELLGGPVLGLTSWSTTLREMARNLSHRSKTGIAQVVEMLGDLGSPRLQHEAALATQQVARAFDAEAVFLRTPGVVQNPELRKLALGDVHTRAALKLLDAVDIAFVGVGPADFHGPLAEGDNFFSAEQLADVRAAGAVGQIHQRFIDAEGKPVKTPLDDLVIGITLDQLRRARRKIVVAGGAAKHKALAAALAGKWIDVLVTDVNSANYLLAAHSSHEHAPKGHA